MSYDNNIQIIPASRYSGMKFYSFGQKRSLGVRGINKLVNMFAKYLLTPVGSDPTDLTYGTNFTLLIGSNVSAGDASEVIQLSVSSANNAIRGWQARNTAIPDDERLGNAELTGLIVLGDAYGPGVAAQIYITNVINEQMQFLLPTLEIRQ